MRGELLESQNVILSFAAFTIAILRSWWKLWSFDYALRLFRFILDIRPNGYRRVDFAGC